MKSIYAEIEKSSTKKAFLGPQGIELAASKQQFRSLQTTFIKSERTRGAIKSDLEVKWCVVGKDTELGDIYYVDVNDNKQAVYFGVFNEKTDSWESILVSSTLIGFIHCINILNELTAQNEPIFVPNSSLIFDLELLETTGIKLAEISENVDFWKTFFVSYVEWLQDEHI